MLSLFNLRSICSQPFFQGFTDHVVGFLREQYEIEYIFLVKTHLFVERRELGLGKISSNPWNSFGISLVALTKVLPYLFR